MISSKLTSAPEQFGDCLSSNRDRSPRRTRIAVGIRQLRSLNPNPVVYELASSQRASISRSSRAAVRVKGGVALLTGWSASAMVLVPYFGLAPLAQPSLRGRYALTSHS